MATRIESRDDAIERRDLFMPDDLPLVVASEHELLHEQCDALNATDFLANTGVQTMCPGPIFQDERPTGEWGLVAYVPRKWKAGTLRGRLGRQVLPSSVEVDGVEVRLDVQPAGRYVRLGRIDVDPLGKTHGTMNMLATHSDGFTVGLTAAHVVASLRSADVAYDPLGTSRPVCFQPIHVQTLPYSPIGHVIQTRHSFIDAAMVRLSSLPSYLTQRDWRWPDWYDQGATVMVYGGASNTLVYGTVARYHIDFSSTPSIRLGQCMLLDVPVLRGDSGGYVLDERGTILGMITGHLRSSGLAVATYAGNVFHTFDCAPIPQ